MTQEAGGGLAPGQLGPVFQALGETSSPFEFRDLRVLFVGINFSPEVTGIAPYTAQAAAFLAASGASVEVFTGIAHYPEWQPTEAPAWRRREFRDDVRVVRFRHYVPARQSVWRRATYEASFATQILASRPSCRPDVVIAVVPTLLSGVAALRLARKARCPLIVWVQDLMGPATQQSGMPGGSYVTAVTRAIEDRLLKAAHSVIVINGGFVRYVQSRGIATTRIHEIRNWTHISEPNASSSDTRSSLGWPDDCIVALHTGNMGLKQGLDNVVRAAQYAAQIDAPIRFVLLGDGSQRQKLELLANGNPYLQFVDPLPAAEYPNVLHAADVLVVNERASAVDMSLPSKLTSYFIAGRPVVAAVSPHGATADEVSRSGAGILVPPERPEALVEALLQLRSSPEVARQLASNGPRYATKNLTAHASLGRLAKLVMEATSGRGTAQ